MADTNPQTIREQLAEIDEEILMADGFEEALLGYTRQFNNTTALYDRRKCIEILMRRDGMNEEEAEEFFEFNVQGAWFGDRTPSFATFLSPAPPERE